MPRKIVIATAAVDKVKADAVKKEDVCLFFNGLAYLKV